MPLTSYNRLSKTLPPYLADRVSQVTRRQQLHKQDDNPNREDDNKPEMGYTTVTASVTMLDTSLQQSFNNAQPVHHSKADFQATVNSVHHSQTQRTGGTKRESPRSQPSPRATEVKGSTVVRPRPIKHSPRTMTSLDHVDLWETSDGDDNDEADACSSSNDFAAVPVSSNSSTPTIPNTVHLFHPLRIDDLEDATIGLVRRSHSPVVCKRNRVETRHEGSRPQSRQSVISPRDHRSRPRSRCGRREEGVGQRSVSVMGPEMSVESPKIHDSTNTLRLFHQQQSNSVYSPVTDSKVFSDLRGGANGVHRKNAWTVTTTTQTTVTRKTDIDNDTDKQITKRIGDEFAKKVANNNIKNSSKSALPDPFRTQTLATSFGLRASYGFEDTRQKVPHYLVKKVTFNHVVNVKHGELSTREDLRSSNNSAAVIKAKHLPVIGRRSNSAVQSESSTYNGTPITC